MEEVEINDKENDNDNSNNSDISDNSGIEEDTKYIFFIESHNSSQEIKVYLSPNYQEANSLKCVEEHLKYKSSSKFSYFTFDLINSLFLAS